MSFLIKKAFAMTFFVAISGCAGMSERMEAQKAKEREAEYEMLSARQEAEEITCKGKSQCDRFFRIASDVIMEMSDMKVQTATENYISTYNPIDVARVGMTARRALGSGESETIKLSIVCADKYKIATIGCSNRISSIYKYYKIRIDSQK